MRFVLLIAFLISLCPAAYAVQGDPIQSNDYVLDLTRTVTSGSTRKIGMGGAFTGLAEGNAAIPDNPAAAAYRPRAFMRPWEFDMVLGTIVTSNDDADNSGSSSLIHGDEALMDAGLMAQYKKWGIGGVGQLTLFESDNLPQNQEAQLLSGTFAVGHSALDDQLAIGVSLNPIGARVQPIDQHLRKDSFRLKGMGWGTGVIWHPDRGPWHFGAAYNSDVSTDQELVVSGTTPVKVGNLIVPKGVHTAGSFSLGTAYEWNEFPLWKTRPAIGTFDVRIFNASPAQANSSKAFLTQTEQPQGQRTIATVHGGLEVEAVPRFLRLRMGTYYEPSRFNGIDARTHITGGFELRFTKFNVWDNRPLAISYAIDSAERYLIQSISVWLYTFTVPVPKN